MRMLRDCGESPQVRHRMIIEADHGDVVRTRMPARRKVAMAPYAISSVW
jgi:hypothetical protein